MRSRYDLSLEETGVALAAPSFGTLPALIPWGHLADRIGERPVATTGLALAAGALAGAATTPSYPAFLALLVVAGAFGSAASAASGRAVMFWFERRQRGLALGIRQTAVPLGGLVASLALPALVHAGGLRAALLLLAGFAGVGAAASLLMREAPGLQPGEEIVSDLHPLRDRRVLRLLVASGLLIAGQVAATGFTVLFLHEQHGLSIAAAAGVLAGAQALGGVARIAAGHWSDRVGTRAVPLRMLGVALAVALLATAAAASGPAAIAAAVLVLAGGLGMSWNGLSFTAATELSGHAQAGAAVGVQQSALNGAGSIVAVAFAAIVAATSWQAAFALVALCPLAAAFVLRKLSV
ncbi:MAG TPA: MFS transporter [Gaiellaceae bacterium]